MNFSSSSSPGRLNPDSSGLPRSSLSTPRSRSSKTPSQAPRQRVDPRALGDELDAHAPEAEEDSQAPRRRRGGGGRQNLDESVPLVKDATGEKVMEGFEMFLRTYTVEVTLPATPGADMDMPPAGDLIYIQQIHAMREFDLVTLYVDFSHLLERDDVLARAISDQYYRFLPFLLRALQNLVREFEPSYLYVNSISTSTPSSGLQTRSFSLAFHHLPIVSSLRDLRTSLIGQLTAISGTVTRTSEVRPELLYGVFKCEECSGMVADVEQQFKYTEPMMCLNPHCGNRNFWELNIEQSKFSDWQKVRIQENANEIPTGSMPRSLDVILRSEMVERAKAGDKCVFTGTFIVVPDVSQLGLPGVNAEMQREARGGGGAAAGIANQGVTGLKSLGVRDLQYKTAFLACMVNDADGRTSGANIRGDVGDIEEDQESFLSSLTEPEIDELKAMVHSDYIYSRLVESIAPTVYGHEIVKKGLLLQLMGGVHKQTREGMNLRGDLNICIVGDPSTSKSQFLKYVCSFLPRAVYTSGKASSAAGLTAAVVKDEETGEFTIEAGALMLADNGICAIDEFDKMDISDQVAIHEAMEQQTISIAKAGIHATLNARTSILAAANPIGGRYNRKASLRANVGMSAPIMSRFDLFFVVLDECNQQVDQKIAQHIVNVHRFQDNAINPEFSTEALQRYIRYARTFSPKLTPEAADVLVEKYRILRQDDSSGVSKNSYRITVRQLESMIRLSEAIARANCTDEITPAFVREAYSLLRQSIIHVEQDDIDFDEEELQGERPGDRRRPAQGEDEGEEMVDGDPTEEDSYFDTVNAQAGSPARPSRAQPGQGERGPSSPNGAAVTPPPAEAKRKMKITHDRYMTLQNLIVMHLAELERTTGKGLDRDDLIDWYLELNEAEFQDVEQLDYEKELIAKVLKKLVKDNYLLEIRGDVQNSLPTSEEEPPSETNGEVRVHYMVHPSVDTGESSSLA